MSISEKDIKKLWGLAGGRCSFPGCDEKCLPFLDSEDPTVIGEMAHVIAKKPKGPRGQKGGGDDTYENLILLCPTHHRTIDKAPEGKFTVEIIHKWKEEHEAEVDSTFLSPKFNNKKELCTQIKRLLIENHQIWLRYGPESLTAKNNPLSNMHEIWKFRKLETLVPNNRRIMNLILTNKEQFSLKEYEYCCEFIEHAEGFEENAYLRRDDVPMFPKQFQEVIDSNV